LLFQLQNHLRSHHAIHLVGVQLSLSAVLCVTLIIASLSARPAYANLDAAARLQLRPALAQPVVAKASAGAPAAAAVDPGVIRLQDLAPQAARVWNASNPIAKGPNPAAKPFHLAAEGVLDEARAVDCMTAAIYYEAGFESLDGERAVAQVVINRLRNPLFPKTVCGVVFQGSDRSGGCQFTFTCDGALARGPQEQAWARARKVAAAALHGYVMRKVGNATHYHADYVAPYWSPTLVKVAVVGQHIFYRWTGGLGLPPAFGGRYAGGEMKGLQIATLDNLAKSSAKLAAAPVVSEAPAAAPQQAAVAPVVEASADKPAALSDATAADLMTPEKVAENARAAAGPDGLDWQGRPRRRDGPPRVARPSSGFGF
jgi:spore germination cell wall hydrolase CwlJ-like protein